MDQLPSVYKKNNGEFTAYASALTHHKTVISKNFSPAQRIVAAGKRWMNTTILRRLITLTNIIYIITLICLSRDYLWLSSLSLPLFSILYSTLQHMITSYYYHRLLRQIFPWVSCSERIACSLSYMGYLIDRFVWNSNYKRIQRTLENRTHPERQLSGSINLIVWSSCTAQMFSLEGEGRVEHRLLCWRSRDHSWKWHCQSYLTLWDKQTIDLEKLRLMKLLNQLNLTCSITKSDVQ